MKIFETHAHYDDEAFKEDRDILLREMHSQGVEYIVNIGCSMESSQYIAELVERYDFLYGTVGVHPDDVERLTEADMEELAMLSRRDKIIAIGEIGLDYHYDGIDRDLQKHWFARQMEVARRQKLPIVVHSRDAAKDTLDLMKAEHARDIGGVIHCFSYGVEMAREYLDMGFYIGVGGVVTFKNGKKLKEVVEYAPLDRILLETDAPYLAPVPYRGKRNCSLYLEYVAEEIAALKGVAVEEVYEATFHNAASMYQITRVAERRSMICTSNSELPFNKLENNIIDAIEEQQLKLGYLKETVRLYYPLSSLNRFLDTQNSVEQMKSALQLFSAATRNRLGGVAVTNKGERFCIAIPPEGTEYIHKHMGTGGFLADLVATVAKEGSTLEDVLRQFYKYSKQVHVEEMKNGEFDYLVYFENGDPDSYYYCITVEESHIIYHRYTKADYEEFGF
ncbi:MAG: YchF/TatD family DNA exonuclease [Lachnospiraceae bacterium]|nr:YchF/TatD family DNA exonuclease [Lachnospiraceae bacterium]